MAANTSRSSTKRSGTSAKRKTSPAKKASTRKATAARKSTRSSRAPSSGSKRRARTTASSNGVVGTVKQAAGRATGPAIAVGAAAAGIAGGIALKNRSRGTKVLGVSLPSIDPKSVAQSVGKASKRFARTSKNVSKDLERAGDQAERIGKILD